MRHTLLLSAFIHGFLLFQAASVSATVRKAEAEGGLLPSLEGALDQHMPPFQCHYGRELGIWRNSSAPGSRWQTINPRCPLRNLIPETPPTDSDPADAHVFPRIVFLSDSIDLNIAATYCSALGGHIEGRFASKQPQFVAMATNASEVTDHYGIPHHKGQANLCISNTSARILHHFIFGVSPVGPFWLDQSIPYMYKIEDAALVWSNYSDTKPDFVVISSNVWDQCRLEMIDTTGQNQHELPLEVLQQYAYNLSRVVHDVRVAFPQVRILFHSHATVNYDDKSYQTYGANNTRSHVSHTFELNAFGLSTARQLGLETVDYNQVLQRFGHPSSYLHGSIHPHSWVNLDFMNIYLNYCAELLRAPREVVHARERHRARAMSNRMLLRAR